MALYSPDVHESQGHEQGLVFATQDGHLGCVGCFLASMLSPDVLITSKANAIAVLLELLHDHTDAQAVAQAFAGRVGLCAPPLVELWVTITDSPARDLSSGLCQLITSLAALSDSLASGLVEVVLQSCLDTPETRPAGLYILGQLLQSSPTACSTTAQVLVSFPHLLEQLLAALQCDHASGSDECQSVITLMCQLVTSPDAAPLLQAAGIPCLLQTASLLSSATAPANTAVACTARVSLRGACLQLLQALLSAEQSVCAWLSDASAAATQQAQQLPALLLAGLKPCLLDQSQPDQQLLAAQVLCMLCQQADVPMLTALLHNDTVECLCECIRLTCHAASRALPTQGPGSVLGKRCDPGSGTARAPGRNLLPVDTETLQAQLLNALQCLMRERDQFCFHLCQGLDSVLQLAEASVASNHQGLIRDTLTLLCVAADPRLPAGSRVKASELRRAIKLASHVFPGPLERGASPVSLPADTGVCSVLACRLAQCAMQSWSAGSAQGQRGRQTIHELVARSLEGLLSITPDTVSPYLAAASDTVHTWVEWLSAAPANGGTDNTLEYMRTLLELTQRALLPAISRCLSCASEVMPAVVSGMRALASVLLRGHSLGTVGDLGSASQGGEQQCVGADITQRARELAADMLRDRWTTTCMELVAHSPQLQLPHEDIMCADTNDPTSTPLCGATVAWQLLIAMQCGSPLLGAAGLARRVAVWLVSQPPQRCVELAGLLSGLPSWTHVMEHLAVQGVSQLGLYSAAPLVVLHTALAVQDTGSVNPAVVVDALVHIMEAHSPTLQRTAGSLTSGYESTSEAHDALLALVRQGLTLCMHLDVTQQCCLSAHNAARLTSCVETYVQVEPSAMELGSEFATCVVQHTEHMPTVVDRALRDWLSQAAHASDTTRTRVHEHIANAATANPSDAALLTLLVTQLSHAGDGGYAASAARHTRQAHPLQAVRGVDSIVPVETCGVLDTIRLALQPQVMAHIVTTDLGASLKRLVHTESRALIAALSSQTSATSLDASARTLSHALQLTCALLACSGPTHGTQMHIDGASQHKTGSNEDYMGVCVSWAVAVADVATHQLFAASPTSHSSHASRASRKGQAARGQGSVAPCSTVVTAVGALQQSVVGCEVIQLLLGLHGHLVVQQVSTPHGSMSDLDEDITSSLHTQRPLLLTAAHALLAQPDVTAALLPQPHQPATTGAAPSGVQDVALRAARQRLCYAAVMLQVTARITEPTEPSSAGQCNLCAGRGIHGAGGCVCSDGQDVLPRLCELCLLVEGPCQAALVHLLWLTACQHQQVSEEVWLVLQNAAAHTDPDTRAAGQLGLVAMQTTRVTRTHGSHTNTLLATQTQVDDDSEGYASLEACVWGPTLLHDTLLGLSQAHTHATSDLVRTPPHATIQAMLPALLLLTSFLPPAPPTHAARAAADGAGDGTDAECETWVVEGFSEFVGHNSNGQGALMSLLLAPPQQLAPWLYALCARLVGAGVLDDQRALDELTKMCRSAVWSEQTAAAASCQLPYTLSQAAYSSQGAGPGLIRGRQRHGWAMQGTQVTQYDSQQEVGYSQQGEGYMPAGCGMGLSGTDGALSPCLMELQTELLTSAQEVSCQGVGPGRGASGVVLGLLMAGWRVRCVECSVEKEGSLWDARGGTLSASGLLRVVQQRMVRLSGRAED